MPLTAAAAEASNCHVVHQAQYASAVAIVNSASAPVRAYLLAQRAHLPRLLLPFASPVKSAANMTSTVTALNAFHTTGNVRRQYLVDCPRLLMVSIDIETQP